MPPKTRSTESEDQKAKSKAEEEAEVAEFTVMIDEILQHLKKINAEKAAAAEAAGTPP